VRLKAILFDLDGTLVDSAGDLRDALNALLAEEGLAPLDLQAVKGMVGDGVAKSSAGSPPAAPVSIDCRRAWRASWSSTSPTLPG